MFFNMTFSIPVLYAIILSFLSCEALAVDGTNTSNLQEINSPKASHARQPVSFEFLSMVGSGMNRQAIIRVNNQSNKDISTIKMLLNYIDNTGKLIEDFPWTQYGSPVVEKQSHSEIKVGMFVPANTSKIEPIVKIVIYDDMTKWVKE